MDWDWLLTISGWAYTVVVVALVIIAIMRRKEAASMLAWCMAIVFLPILGPLLFLTFGLNRFPRRVRRIKSHREDFDERFHPPEAGTEAEAEAAVKQWRPLARGLEALGEPPRRGGNATRLFRHGRETFDEVVRAIDRARHHVHVEFFIFREDELGRQLLGALEAAAERGVEVRFVVDGVGSFASWRLRRRLRERGGRVAMFSPIWPWFGAVSPNLRNHRKIVICDGREAFFGGMNVGVEYLGRWRQRRKGRDWYDLHMWLSGPAVRDLQRLFVTDWDYCSGELLDGTDYFPDVPAAGDTTAQVIGGGPDRDVNPIRYSYFGALSRARREILIATPYFVPDMALRECLRSAALAGVEVHVVTQHAPPDNWLAHFCAFFYMDELLEAGVKFHGYAEGMMHAKAVAIDDEWAMLGTANLDNRSMFLNFEQMTIFDGADVVGAIHEELRELRDASEPFDLEELRSRAWYERLAISFSHLLAPLL